jgi:hypothetical protein
MKWLISAIIFFLVSCECGPIKVQIVGSVKHDPGCWYGPRTVVEVVTTGQRQRICGYYGTPGEVIIVERCRLTDSDMSIYHEKSTH